MGIFLLDTKIHDAIYAIYGFVRLADEIVDTMHEYNQADLLKEFVDDTWKAIYEKISLNPILNSFQIVVNQYAIDKECIRAFFNSMQMDLYKNYHDEKSYKDYILGSAEVVGLMCLSVFVNANQEEYIRLKPYAMSLGAAFQKVNFLRDYKADNNELGRVYFPQGLDLESKVSIMQDIDNDLKHAVEGIRQLPNNCRLGVYAAYILYLELFKKLKKASVEDIKLRRFRVSNFKKLFLAVKAVSDINRGKLEVCV
ncbi:MAG: squalene/phytoene synthase family protein [Candidatus Caenarcaniphilales bacterium]|jgi:phytoene/squalene synthetase|nr:squalene/phytoene synthase family protein [Candidatus Caenarcaniphilales bacterium]